MIRNESAARQWERARGDGLRVVVSGAGIAGLTLAALLGRQGLHPVLIDRADPGDLHGGYMLALMPLVDPALDELEVHDAYRAASIPLSRYAVHSHTGRLLRTSSFESILSRFGEYRGIERGALVDVLAGSGRPVAFQTSVSAVTETADAVQVTLTGPDGDRRLTADILVAADGVHSATRALLRQGCEVERVETGWGGWVAWAAGDDRMDLVEEVWGDGSFTGVYGVPGRLGVFLGGPDAATRLGPASFAERVRGELRHASPRLHRALEAVAAEPDPYYWPMADIRTAHWTSPHTALLGDAAAAFMPTAGIGAGMAIESAWRLGRALSSATPAALPERLAAFERVQRPRVEAAQANSRSLARLMFRRSLPLALARDAAARLVSIRAALRPIVALLESAPTAADRLRRG